MSARRCFMTKGCRLTHTTGELDDHNWEKPSS